MTGSFSRQNLARGGEWALLALAVGLSLAALVGLTRSSSSDSHAAGAVERSTADASGSGSEAGGEEDEREDRWSLASGRVSRNNPFVVNEKPPPSITGILGDTVILSNGRTATAGETVGELKVLEVGGDWARVEIEGKERTMHVFGRGSGVRVTTAPPPDRDDGRDPADRSERPTRNADRSAHPDSNPDTDTDSDSDADPDPQQDNAR